jgi:nitrite reductase/ring-hydroxylating ferredoxin subunit
MSQTVPAADVPEGTVTEAGRYALGNNGEYFAVGRKCRHLRADLAGGSIDTDGCLVCPWHGAKYDVRTGRMVRGPQGVFAKIPGLGTVFKALTSVLPLARGKVTTRGDDLVVD